MKIATGQVFRAQLDLHKSAAPQPASREHMDSLVLGATAPLRQGPPKFESQASTVKPWPLAARLGVFTGLAAGAAAGFAAPQLAMEIAAGTFVTTGTGSVGLTLLNLMVNPQGDEKTEKLLMTTLHAGWGAAGGILVGLPLGVAARFLWGGA